MGIKTSAGQIKIKNGDTWQSFPVLAGGSSGGISEDDLQDLLPHVTLSQAEYDAMYANGDISPDGVYFIPDSNGISEEEFIPGFDFNTTTIDKIKAVDVDVINTLKAMNVNTTTLTVDGEEVADFIIDSGELDVPNNDDESKKWKYIKFNNGFAMCWYNDIQSGVSTTETHGSLYSTNTFQVYYPFSFTGGPHVYFGTYSSSHPIQAYQTQSFASYVGYKILSTSSGTLTSVHTRILAIGRWKD